MALFLFATYHFERINLNSVYGRHAIYQLYTLAIFCIGVFEIRYISQRLPAPRLTWFYTAYTDHEMQQMILNWQDTIEENMNKFLATSKEQLDYYLLHKEFVYIKKRSLSNFLINERSNLSNHFHERTNSMLKTIEHLENNNIRNKIKGVAEESLKVVLSLMEDPQQKKAILNASFESALIGIRKGSMQYEGDVIFPTYIKELKLRTEPLLKLSKEQ